MMKRFGWLVALGASLGGVGAVDAQDRPLPADNRWVVMIDASETKDFNDKTEAARVKFCEELCESGIPEDHIFTYTTNAKNADERPTREKIVEILDALRDVSGSVGLDLEGSSYWRGDDVDAPCEVQFYITARGVSFEKQGVKTRNFLLACDVDPEEITGADDERLLDVAELERALTTPEEGAPIDRVFLAINFLSTETATRGSGKARGLRDASTRNAATPDDWEYDDARGFSYVRILTKNERLDDERVDSFYQTFAQGMSGYADLTNDRDGLVGAVELATYAMENGRLEDVDFTYDGSASYSVAYSRREATVPPGLFSELEKVFTLPENKALRESARKRREGTSASAKRGGGSTASGKVNDDAATRSGKKGGVLR